MAGLSIQQAKRNGHAAPRNLAHLHRDRGYRWQDRDPVCEEVCRRITDSGLSIGDIIEAVLDASSNRVHLSYGTLANWLSGKTRRPQNWTMDWVLTGLGLERGPIQLRDHGHG